jgi:uncharacterized membrane protein
MNRQAPFTIIGALQEGWKLTKENIGFLILYQIILYFFTFLAGGAQTDWRWVFGHFLAWIIVILGKMGLYNSALLITAHTKPGFDQFYQNWRMILSWIVSSVLFGILFLIGFALLIVPGFYVWARYGFYPFFILDKKSGPLEALRQSAEATEGIRWPIFLLFLTCAGLDILGLLFFGIGLFIAAPVTILALAIVYRQITSPDKNENELILPVTLQSDAFEQRESL